MTTKIKQPIQGISDKQAGLVAGCLSDAREYIRRGDVVLREQVARTLDDLVGARIEGVWCGGRTIIRVAEEMGWPDAPRRIVDALVRATAEPA